MLQKEWKIAFSNVRHRKAITISLTLLIFLVAFFLDICLSLRGIPQVIDAAHTELHGCDLRVQVLSAEAKIGQYTGQIKQLTGVLDVECAQCRILGQATVFPDTERRLEQKKVVESCAQSDSSKFGICLPVSMKSEGYQLGDTYLLQNELFGSYAAVCEITAFARYPSMFSTDSIYENECMRVDMSKADFTRFEQEFRDYCMAHDLERFVEKSYQYYLITIAEQADLQQVQKAVSEVTGLEIEPPVFTTYESIREEEIFYIELYSGILTAFSILVLVVVCFVILSRISDAIFTEMPFIGTLGAMGFSCGEIRIAYALQYILYAVTGVAAGILASYACAPFLNNIVMDLSYAGSVAALHPASDLTTALSILVLVFLVLLLATRRFRKYPPVVALSGGMQSHSFAKNYAPVETTKCELSGIFAIKNILRNKKQTCLTLVSVLLLTFATTTIMSVRSNLDRREFWNYLLGYENPKASVFVKGEHSESVRAEIAAMEGIDKALFLRYPMLQTEGYAPKLDFTCMEDFSETKYLSVIRGEMPERDNEIALAYPAAKALSKDVGDKITLTYTRTENGKATTYSGEYLITGIADNASGGNLMTLEGVRKFPDSFANTINVYSDTLQFQQIKEKLTAAYGEFNINGKILSVDDSERMLNESLATYTSALDIVMLVMSTVTFLVILFLLLVVIRSSLHNRRVEFGIQKALGFHAGEIIGGIVLTYFPVVSIGAILGGALSLLTSRQAIQLLFRIFFDTRNVNVLVFPDVVLLFAGAIAVFAFLMTLLFSLKVKRITPRELITE